MANYLVSQARELWDSQVVEAQRGAAQLQIVATTCTSMKKKHSAARKSAGQRKVAQLQLAATSCN